MASRCLIPALISIVSEANHVDHMTQKGQNHGQEANPYPLWRKQKTWASKSAHDTTHDKWSLHFGWGGESLECKSPWHGSWPPQLLLRPAISHMMSTFDIAAAMRSTHHRPGNHPGAQGWLLCLVDNHEVKQHHQAQVEESWASQVNEIGIHITSNLQWPMANVMILLRSSDIWQ